MNTTPIRAWVYIQTPAQVLTQGIRSELRMLIHQQGIRSEHIGLSYNFVGDASVLGDQFRRVKSQVEAEGRIA